MESNKQTQKPKFARPNYYQGILQLRDASDDVMDFVYSQIQKRPDVAVTRTAKLDNGKDLYITSQKFIRILGKKLRESFGGELKVSSKLHTRNRQGKDLYRVNVLFKRSRYKRGEIISVKGDEVRIIRLGIKIFARNLKTGRKVTIRRSDLPRD